VNDAERVRRTLTDFLEFAELAARLVERGRPAFEGDEMLPLAAESVLHKIGEAIARLPEEFTAEHPDVRWRAIKGMRNKIAHDYRAVDHGLIWNALEKRLPLDAAAVRRIVDGL